MVSEEQKEILKERLKKARIAKIEKKNQIKEINKDKTVIVPKVDVPKVDVPKVDVPKVEVDVDVPKVFEPVSEPKKTPKPREPRAEKSDPKQKYAKLVFYTEPNGRKLKKLSNLISNDDSDSDAEQPPPKVVSKSRKEIEQDEMIDKMNKETERANRLRNLALHFFN